MIHANPAIIGAAPRCVACHLYDRCKATGEMVTALPGVAREVAPVEALPRDWRRPWYATAAIRRRLEHECKVRRWTRTGSYGRLLGAHNFGKPQ